MIVVNGLKFILFPPEWEIALYPFLEVIINVLALVVSLHKAKEFGTIDTYARKLFLINDFKQLSLLKMAVSV